MTDLEFKLIALVEKFSNAKQKGEIDEVKHCALLIYKISSLTPYEAATKANDLFKEKICIKVTIAIDDYSSINSFSSTLKEMRCMYEAKYEAHIKEDCLEFIESYRKENEK